MVSAKISKVVFLEKTAKNQFADTLCGQGGVCKIFEAKRKIRKVPIMALK